MTNQQREVVAFLLGETELDGVWFGEPHPSGKPYWWRDRLSKATLPTQSAGVEERARELLAAEYERAGFPLAAQATRDGSGFQNMEVRAIAAALRTPASEGDGGRELSEIETQTLEQITQARFTLNDERLPDDVLNFLRDLALHTNPPTQQEALAVALLREVAEWIDGWEPNFVDDAEWSAVAERIQAITQPGSPT